MISNVQAISLSIIIIFSQCLELVLALATQMCAVLHVTTVEQLMVTATVVLTVMPLETVVQMSTALQVNTALLSHTYS